MSLLSADSTTSSTHAREESASADAGATLPLYIARVQAIQPLSREEEYELACRVRDCATDTEAARKLVEANLRYVVAIALSYRRYGVRLADLISEGNVGLDDRAEEVRPHAGHAFRDVRGALDPRVRARPRDPRVEHRRRRRRPASLEGVLPAAAREGEDPRVDERRRRGERAARGALRYDERQDRAAREPSRGARRLARREGVRRRRSDGARHGPGHGAVARRGVPVARALHRRCTRACARRSRSSTRASASSSRCG